MDVGAALVTQGSPEGSVCGRGPPMCSFSSLSFSVRATVMVAEGPPGPGPASTAGLFTPGILVKEFGGLPTALRPHTTHSFFFF